MTLWHRGLRDLVCFALHWILEIRVGLLQTCLKIGLKKQKRVSLTPRWQEHFLLARDGRDGVWKRIGIAGFLEVRGKCCVAGRPSRGLSRHWATSPHPGALFEKLSSPVLILSFRP